MKRLMLLVAAVMPATALAQTGDEWTNFPSSNPPKQQPAPQTQTPDVPPAQPKPKPAPSTLRDTPDVPPQQNNPPPPHQDPNAKARVEERLKAAEQGKAIPQSSQTGTATDLK